jgi:hypothetical protein
MPVGLPWLGRLAAAIAACLVGAAMALAQAGAQTEQELRAVFAAGDLPRAFALAGELTDPLARADWLSYLAHQAGDLDGVLLAARAGLTHDPCHARLLARAADAATSLGHVGALQELAPALERCAGLAGIDPADRSALKRCRSLVGPRLAELEAARLRSRAALRRAWGALALGLTLALGLALLAGRSGQVQEPRS